MSGEGDDDDCDDDDGADAGVSRTVGERKRAEGERGVGGRFHPLTASAGLISTVAVAPTTSIASVIPLRLRAGKKEANVVQSSSSRETMKSEGGEITPNTNGRQCEREGEQDEARE